MYKFKLFLVQSIVFATIITVSKSVFNEKGKGNTINFEKHNRRNIQINKVLPRNENDEKQSNDNNERLPSSTVNALNPLLHPINIYNPQYVSKRQQITQTRTTRSVVSAGQQVVNRADNLGQGTSLDRKFNKVGVKLDKLSSRDITSTYDNFNKNDSPSQHKFLLENYYHTYQVPSLKQNWNSLIKRYAQFSNENTLNQQNVNPYIPSTQRTVVYPYLPGQDYPNLPGQQVSDSASNLKYGTKFHNKFDNKFGVKLDVSPVGDVKTQNYLNKSGSKSQDNFITRTGYADYYAPQHH